MYLEAECVPQASLGCLVGEISGEMSVGCNFQSGLYIETSGPDSHWVGVSIKDQLMSRFPHFPWQSKVLLLPLLV